MSTGGRLSKVWLTHTDVASHWSAGGFIRPEEWIISPASLSICWTFPHSSIVACWRYFWMVEMWTPNHVERTAVINFDKPDSNNVLPVPCWTTTQGHRSMQVWCHVLAGTWDTWCVSSGVPVNSKEQSVVWWFTQRGFDSQARQRRVEWDLQVKDKYKFWVPTIATIRYL